MKPREHLLVVVEHEDRVALRREAVRRLDAGEARRLDVSAIVRELIATWREARP